MTSRAIRKKLLAAVESALTAVKSELSKTEENVCKDQPGEIAGKPVTQFETAETTPAQHLKNIT